MPYKVIIIDMKIIQKHTLHVPKSYKKTTPKNKFNMPGHNEPTPTSAL
jgi:hypothetical protein